MKKGLHQDDQDDPHSRAHEIADHKLGALIGVFKNVIDEKETKDHLQECIYFYHYELMNPHCKTKPQIPFVLNTMKKYMPRGIDIIFPDV